MSSFDKTEEEVLLENQRRVLHDGFLSYEKWKNAGNSKGFYYFLFNIWQGMNADYSKLANEPESVLEVLLVDDQQDKLYLMRELFLQACRELNIQCNLELAQNGRQGLRLLNQKKFDLVFSDNRMPEMNGRDLFEMIRESSHYPALLWVWTCSCPEEVLDTMDFQGVRRMQSSLNLDSVHDTLLEALMLKTCRLGLKTA